jgi:hypothetical protein
MKEWHTAHFFSSETADDGAFAVIVLNQPIELELEIFQRILRKGTSTPAI